MTSRVSESEPGFDPITPELLQTDKNFIKLLKKQQKEMDALKKRHNKDKYEMICTEAVQLLRIKLAADLVNIFVSSITVF